MIEVRELSKSYEGLGAVCGARFTVRQGEVVGLVGPEGAGKSTLLRMLAGIVTPSAGEAIVAGISTAREPLLLKSQVGYVAGDVPLPPRPSLREMFLQTGEVHAIPSLELELRIQALVTAFELERCVNLPFARLKPEQRQRFKLARALLHDPPALLLDEPVHGLEPGGGRFALLTIRAACGAGKAVLLATRSLRDAESLCDRVLLMDRGQVVAPGTAGTYRESCRPEPFRVSVLAPF